jgi:hypothetical protein
VETEKIDFWTVDDFDVSRTRLTDERDGIQHDRVIAWLKHENVYVIFDIVKFLETDFFTLSTLWHTTTVLDQGENYFVSAVDVIRGREMPQGTALRIDFPQRGIRQQGTFELERNLEPAAAIYQTLSSHYYQGQIETFVTVLTPVPRDNPSASPVTAIRLLDPAELRAGIGVVLEMNGEEVYVCAKTDLMRDILAANVRPRYTFESGRVSYGPFATDASFFYARKSRDTLQWGGTHLVGAYFQDRELFMAPQNTFTLEPDDWNTGFGAPKYRYWEGTVRLP